jgi:hypothetical protein
MTTTSEPGRRILDAFEGVSGETRASLSEFLRSEGTPFLADLGLALQWPPNLALMLTEKALSEARWNGSSALLDRLGDGEPWRTVREALAEALAGPEACMEILADGQSPAGLIRRRTR